MKPKVYTSIDINEARSPLVRVVHADEWDLLINELGYLRGERAAVVAWLREEYDTHSTQDAADHIERGEHRREEES
jgi:hypothetical protein